VRIIAGFSAVSKSEIMMVPYSSFPHFTVLCSADPNKSSFGEWKSVKMITGGTGEFSRSQRSNTWGSQGMWVVTLDILLSVKW